MRPIKYHLTLCGWRGVSWRCSFSRLFLAQSSCSALSTMLTCFLSPVNLTFITWLWSLKTACHLRASPWPARPCPPRRWARRSGHAARGPQTGTCSRTPPSPAACCCCPGPWPASEPEVVVDDVVVEDVSLRLPPGCRPYPGPAGRDHSGSVSAASHSHYTLCNLYSQEQRH